MPIKKDHFRQWAVAATLGAFDFNRVQRTLMGKKENLLGAMHFLPDMLNGAIYPFFLKG